MSKKMLRALPTQNYDDFITYAQDRVKMASLRQEVGLTVPQQVTLIKAFVFTHYAREVVGNPITEADVIMIKEGRQLLELATRGEREPLQAKLSSYATLLTEWLHNDRPRISYPFAAKFHQLHQIAEAAKKQRHYYYQEVAALANHSQQQLLSILYSLRGIELPNSISAEQILDHLRTTFMDIADHLEGNRDTVSADPELHAQYCKDASTLFWNLFREQLPSYLPIVHLLSDFLHRYARLDQNVRRAVYLIEEQIDIEFIKQQIETQAVTVEQLRGYLRVILDATKAISAQVDEEQLEARFGSLITAEIEPYVMIHNFFQALFTYYDDLQQRVAAALPNPRAYGVAAALSSS